MGILDKIFLFCAKFLRLSVNKKEIFYINTLSDVRFILTHKEILKKTKCVTNPRVKALADSYELIVKDMEQLVHIPYVMGCSDLAADRDKAYNVCHRVVESLHSCVPDDHEATANALYRAFCCSSYGASMAWKNETYAKAEIIVSSISRQELEFFPVWRWVDDFVELNRKYFQSQEDKLHNRKVRGKRNVLVARHNCAALYRCVLVLCKNLASQGDEECKRFIAWTKSSEKA